MTNKKPKRAPKTGRKAGVCLEDRFEELPAADEALTLSEFAKLIGRELSYVRALLREGTFTEALVQTPDGPRIGLAALPMYVLVAEVAERVANGAITMKQAAHVIDEIRPLIPQMWQDELAGRPSRVAVEFPKLPDGIGQTDFDLTFVQQSVARWMAGASWLLRRRGVRK
jgi:hypothetical protein